MENFHQTYPKKKYQNLIQKHYSTISGAKADDTHRRHNQPHLHKQGERLLQQRRLMNFIDPLQEIIEPKETIIISSLPPHSEPLATIKSWQKFYKVVCSYRAFLQVSSLD